MTDDEQYGVGGAITTVEEISLTLEVGPVENDTQPQDVLDDLKDTFEEKNEDYGNSWEKAGVIKRVMADDGGPEIIEHDGAEYVRMADTPQLSTAFAENVDGLFTRLLDKLLRAYTLTLLNDEPAVDNESTTDAARDLAGYAAMLASLIENEANDG